MTEWLQCSGCEEKLHFPQGVHVYVRGKVPSPLQDLRQLQAWVAVPTRRGWCKTCGTPTFGERVPSAKELMAAAALIRDPNHPYIDDDLAHLRIEDIQLLFDGLGHRGTAARCLMCGGVDWFRLEVSERGSIAPGLRHSECGEPLQYHHFIGSFNGITSLRTYTFEGVLIAQGTTR